MSRSKSNGVAEAVKKLRPKKGSSVEAVTLSTGDKSVTLHQDGRTESSGTNGTAKGVVEALVEQAAGNNIGPLNMVSLVRVPTNIGPCCAEEESKYAIGDVGMKREKDGKCLLWATDGRLAVIVPAEAEDYSDKQLPRRIPKALAKPGKEGNRELRCGVGTTQTIFGFTRVWVDDEAGRFAPEAMEGQDLPIADVLPDLAAGEHVFVSLNTALLSKIAQAVNSPDGPNCLQAVVLAINLNDKAKPIAVIGDTGIGVLMPTASADKALDSAMWNKLRERWRKAEKADTPAKS